MNIVRYSGCWISKDEISKEIINPTFSKRKNPKSKRSGAERKLKFSIVHQSR
jgi:hypothetical protein